VIAHHPIRWKAHSLCILIIYLIVRGFTIASPQEGRVQHWSMLASHCDLVVVGSVEMEFQVLRLDKLFHKGEKIERLPSGEYLAPIPNPEEYRLGKLYRFRIKEIMLGSEKAKRTTTIDLFVPGWDFYESSPKMLRGESYVVFASPFNGDRKAYQGASVVDPKQVAIPISPFAPETAFIIPDEDRGVVQITTDNKSWVDEIKDATRARKLQ
jgi:hypothetical protein